MSKHLVKPENKPILVTRTSALIDDALMIIQTQLAYFMKQSNRGVSLDLKSARILQNYMDVLVKLSKEEREREKHEDPAKLTDQELLKLVNELVLAKQVEAPKPKEDYNLKGTDEE